MVIYHRCRKIESVREKVRLRPTLRRVVHPAGFERDERPGQCEPTLVGYLKVQPAEILMAFIAPFMRKLSAQYIGDVVAWGVVRECAVCTLKGAEINTIAN